MINIRYVAAKVSEKLRCKRFVKNFSFPVLDAKFESFYSYFYQSGLTFDKLMTIIKKNIFRKELGIILGISWQKQKEMGKKYVASLLDVDDVPEY